MNKLSSRFAQLAQEAADLEKTKTRTHSEYRGEYLKINSEKLLEWRIKAKNLLQKACGSASVHVAEFSSLEKGGAYITDRGILLSLQAILIAAQDDYDGGFLVSTTNLVAAELFDDQLGQASELLRNGYSVAAAVVAGTVLETTLRRLCDLHGISHGKLDKMNADLAKSDVYTLLVQKRTIALADIRNNAAHGKPENFSKSDVEDLIDYAKRFAADYIAA